MTQLELRLPNPPTIDLDGYVDDKTGFRFIGKAAQQFDGSWHCLADVYGCLCLVQLDLTPAADPGTPL